MLSARRIQSLLHVANGARQGTLSDRLKHLSEHMQRAIPSVSSNAIVIDPAGAEQAHCEMDPDVLQAYVDHYYQLDPTLDFMLANPGVVERSSRFIPARQFGRTDYSTNVLLAGRIRYIVATTLALPGGSTLLFSVHRPLRSEDYADDDLNAFRLVLPDLKRAVFGGLLTERLAASSGSDESSELAPVVELSPEGVPLEVNPRALGWLQAADPSLATVMDLLVAGAQQAHLRGEAVRALPSAAGWIRLAFYRHPDVPARVVALLERFDTQADVLAAFVGLGLTMTEGRVAVLAVGGSSNRQIASTLGVARDTVKGHLASVYRKAGVRSRSALAALSRGRI